MKVLVSVGVAGQCRLMQSAPTVEARLRNYQPHFSIFCLNINREARVAQRWERSPVTTMVPSLIPGPGIICELSLLVLSCASRVFLRVLRFSSLHKNQPRLCSVARHESYGGSQRRPCMPSTRRRWAASPQGGMISQPNLIIRSHFQVPKKANPSSHITP